MSRRRVCVVTGTRAEFGLLRCLIQAIQAEPGLELQLIATGMHLSPEFGLTYREIEAAGIPIDARVEMLLSADSSSAVGKSMGLGLIGFADAYARLQPDLVLLLGDRFEIFAAAAAAMVAAIPIAHLHGGETTEGAFDESIRHAITKMAQLHFVAAEPYRRRVIQLGEAPERVFLVGGLGIDAIRRLPLLDRAALEQSLDFRLGARNLLITFHPVTLEGQASSRQQMAALLEALHAQPADTHLIFTMPNADTGGRELMAQVNEFVAAHPQARAYTSLGQLRYLSCLAQVDGVVGNSSSGLAEAPSFRCATVDIGDRQKGRLAAGSVIHCEAEAQAIRTALARVFDPAFQASLASVVNPYGEGGASERILAVLRDHPLEGLLKKRFHDLPA